ncbi:MAG: MFS transporter [Spirochaetaceae bacterium]|nr:MFS transporter [Spirochaetaceae bacterium]|tara:strand:- start:12248 stop:13642 length:1395 start_codon:yes stop_codon:yes gene_type:complete
MQKLAQVEDLPLSKQIAYAVGQFGWSIIVNILGVQLVFFYNPPGDAGIPQFLPSFEFLVVITAVVLLTVSGRLFDAITDPLIANMSDRSRNPRGRRIPFMAIGAIPAAVLCVMMFVPVFEPQSWMNFGYLVVIQLLFFLFVTMYVTPFFALLPELGHNSTQKLNLSTLISITWALGLMLAAQTAGIGGALETAFGLNTVQGFQVATAILAFFAIILMFVPVLIIDEKRYCVSEPSQVPVMEALKTSFRNRNFIAFVFSDFVYFCALTIILTGVLYYATVLLYPENPQEGKQLAGLLMVVMTITSFAMYPFVNLLARKFGKRILVLSSFGFYAFVFLYVFFMGPLPIPPLAQGMILAVSAAVPNAFLGILQNAVLADIAEHDAYKTGIKQEGMYFGARTFMQKFGQTAGLFIFAGLTVFGIDPGDDIGIRYSGVAGMVLCILAVLFFMRYDEKTVLRELQEAEKK